MTEMLLREDLANLDEAVRARLALAGFDAEHLVRLARQLFERASSARADTERNRIQGLVEPPAEGDLLQAPVAGYPGYDGLVALGRSALLRGEVAFCVMAGGMATRMGGIVKALV
jgi:UTP--glucose-1-phosphate uridylyltransferase